MDYNDVIIRPCSQTDAETLGVGYCFPWSTCEKTKERWNKYFLEQQNNIRTVAVLEYGQEILGYGSLLFQSEYPHFINIPEISDVWIFEQHRGRGLGTSLITFLEEIAEKMGYQEIGIGVGLYADYGSAQKLYFQLGYAPDGKGITYKNQPTIPGESYPLDDDLIFWMKKSLTYGT